MKRISTLQEWSDSAHYYWWWLPEKGEDRLTPLWLHQRPSVINQRPSGYIDTINQKCIRTLSHWCFSCYICFQNQPRCVLLYVPKINRDVLLLCASKTSNSVPCNVLSKVTANVLCDVLPKSSAMALFRVTRASQSYLTSRSRVEARQFHKRFINRHTRSRASLKLLYEQADVIPPLLWVA